jgi:hypothetical protein
MVRAVAAKPAPTVSDIDPRASATTRLYFRALNQGGSPFALNLTRRR